jgi:hypothetical protein
MSRRKQGYLFLAFALVALMSNASIFVYRGMPAHGVESLKTYSEFTWIRYTVTTLWGWPAPIVGIPGLYGWIPFLGFKIPFWFAPALAVCGSVLAVMNVYRLADFHRRLLLGIFAVSVLISIAAGVLIIVAGELVPGYSLSLFPPFAGFGITKYFMRTTDPTIH